MFWFPGGGPLALAGWSRFLVVNAEETRPLPHLLPTAWVLNHGKPSFGGVHAALLPSVLVVESSNIVHPWAEGLWPGLCVDSAVLWTGGAGAVARAVHIPAVVPGGHR